MADSLERITNLVALLLETRTPLTLDEITNELSEAYPAGAEARRGAFERDKALLREVGVPIDTVVLSGDQAGRTAYRIDRSRYELADLHLAPDEQHALQLAVAAIRNTDAQFGLLKLGGTAASAAPVTANIPDVPWLPLLRDSAAARAAVTFTYHGTSRVLQPYSLLLRGGFWYVIGHDVGHDEVRTYRVDRIEGDVEAGPAGSFERPAGFDPLATFPTDPKALGVETADRAQVRVDARRAAAVEREIGPAAVVGRSADGSIEVEVACANLPAFRSWLFGLGAHAEVLGPPEVRADVVGWLRTLVARR
jgi:predicted DNA-binding transcriptional regulator YafY